MQGGRSVAEVVLSQRRHIDAAWALVCRETERQLGRMDAQVVDQSAVAT
jgi:hypothetical protein